MKEKLLAYFTRSRVKAILIALLICALLAGLIYLTTVLFTPSPEDEEETEEDGTETTEVVGSSAVNRDFAGTTLNIYNWGEYISDGSEGTLDVIANFEELTGITVNYSTFASNEDMYAKLKSGAVSYDIVIPSDYMIAQLIAENLVRPLNFDNIPNFANINADYRNLYYDPDNLYSVPYSYGMVGLIYNTELLGDISPDSWSIMWDEQYSGRILTFNNPRDGFAIAQFLLGQDVNTQNPEDWQKAYEKLLEQKPLIQSYVMDEIFNKMENGEAAIAPYYAGDFLTMYDNNPNLAFVYPKEGTNVFVDALCIPQNATNVGAAEMFINYMLDADIATANAEYICYASPNDAVRNNEDYDLYGDPILYPEEGTVKAEYFHNLPKATKDLYNGLWSDLKIENSGSGDIAVYMICGVLLAGGAAWAIWRAVVKYKRAKAYRDA